MQTEQANEPGSGRWDPDKWITDDDRSRSRTSFNLAGLREAVRPLDGTAAHAILDVGCGYGALSCLVGEYLQATEVHGVDIDDRVVEGARAKGVLVVATDAGSEPLPYEDGTFDFVMSLGMMDYLVSFDGLIREMNRVLRPGGHVLIALPNLGSWNNRLALAFGYQPRDVEISSELLVGVPKRPYPGKRPAGHIHVPTVRAFEDLMDHHGFRSVAVTPGRPRKNTYSWPVEMADRLLSKRATLARRFYYLGGKERVVPPPAKSAQLPYQTLP